MLEVSVSGSDLILKRCWTGRFQAGCHTLRRVRFHGVPWLVGSGCYVYIRNQCSAQSMLKTELPVPYRTSAGARSYSSPVVVWSWGLKAQ